MVGAFREPSCGRRTQPIHSIPYSVAQPLERGSNNYYSIIQGRYYMTQEQDLLTGSVPKKLIRFAFPLFLANLLQALYNVVDMLVVGKMVGETGLAAISNASMLCFIINSLCIGLTMGGSVLVAQYKGAGDQKGQRDTIGMLFLLSLAASVVVTMLGLAVYEPLFRALDVPAEAYPDACGYMEIICWGTVFVFGYNTVCSILKGLGDSKTPLFFVGVATILNVLLDVLLVSPNRGYSDRLSQPSRDGSQHPRGGLHHV